MTEVEKIKLKDEVVFDREDKDMALLLKCHKSIWREGVALGIAQWSNYQGGHLVYGSSENRRDHAMYTICLFKQKVKNADKEN